MLIARKNNKRKEYKDQINAAAVGHFAKKITRPQLSQVVDIQQVTHNSNAGRYDQDPKQRQWRSEESQ